MIGKGSSRARLFLPVPIVRGALRGRWWLPTGGGKVWRVLGGTYEAEQTAVFRRLIRPGDEVLDLGAHLGYYTLLASRLAGPRGRVFAFEPDPTNAWYLRRHARLNACANVRVVESAVFDREGELPFEPGNGSGTGHLEPGGPLRVHSVRLDDYAAANGIIPAVIKIDVEGAESAVLEGGRRTLAAARPVLFLSTHDAENRGRCERLLLRLDYRTETITGSKRRGAGEVLCVPAERDAALADSSGEASRCGSPS